MDRVTCYRGQISVDVMVDDWGVFHNRYSNCGGKFQSRFGCKPDQAMARSILHRPLAGCQKGLPGIRIVKTFLFNKAIRLTIINGGDRAET